MLAEKCAVLVVQSYVVTFAVLCGEQSCDVERKGNTVERQIEVNASCLHYCERFIVLAVYSDAGEQGNVWHLSCHSGSDE